MGTILFVAERKGAKATAFLGVPVRRGNEGKQTFQSGRAGVPGVSADTC